MSASGTATLTSSGTCSIGAGAIATFSGTISVSFTVGGRYLDSTGLYVIQVGMAGEQFESLADPDASWSTITPFGSLTVTASGTVSLSDGSQSGGGAITPTLLTGSLAVGIVVTKTSSTDVSVSSTVEFSGGMSGTYPMGAFGEEDELGGAGIGVNFAQTKTGTALLANACSGSNIVAGTIASTSITGGMNVDDDQGLETNTETIGTSGSATVTGFRTFIHSDEDSAPELAGECDRYVTFAVDYPNNSLDIYDMAMAGRVSLDGTVKCSGVAPSYHGGGVMTQPSDSSEPSYEIAGDWSFSPVTQGISDTAAIFNMNYELVERPITLQWEGDISGTFTLTMSGGPFGTVALPTSALSPLGSAAAMQTALQALVVNANEYVRVRSLPDTVIEYQTDIWTTTRVFLVSYSSISNGGFNQTKRTLSGNFSALTADAPPVAGVGSAAVPQAFIKFLVPGHCLTGAAEALTPHNTGTGYEKATITFGTSARNDLDPNYYCDCGSACEDSAILLTLADGVSKAYAGTQTDSDPCELNIAGDVDYHGTYAYSPSRGRMELTLSDDFGIVLTAYRYCTPGGQLGALIIHPLSSLLTTYPDLTATVS